jgi:hypothetical protein
VSFAASFSFAGNFTEDDDLQFFAFTINDPSTVTITTLSYAGGTNAAGNIIPRGGFDPIVSLFDSLGDPVGTNNDGGCAAVGQDPVTNACWDSFLTSVLNAGSYTVVLSQSDNTPVGTLAEGFSREGQGNFTGPTYVGAPGAFWDANPNQRTSAWALDILNVDTATISGIPEPATGLLLTGALGILGLLRLRAGKNSPRP